MSKAILRRLSSCALIGALATACTTTAPPPAAPAPVPTRKDSTAAPPPAAAARWTPKRTAGSWHYELRSSGTVSLAGDTTADSLPLARTVLYTVSIEPTGVPNGGSPAFQVTGSVDSVAVTIPERIPTPTAGSNSKPRFQGAMAANGHLTALASDAMNPCQDATDPLSAAATSLFIALPEGISPNESWTDTVSNVTCRGRMPLVTTATRQYRAITDTLWQGRAALLLTRHDSLAIRSRADSATDTTVADTTDTMAAMGSGHGDFTLFVDPRSGVLLEATGTSHTEILVTTPSSRFPFREDARQTITLLK